MTKFLNNQQWSEFIRKNNFKFVIQGMKGVDRNLIIIENGEYWIEYRENEDEYWKGRQATDAEKAYLMLTEVISPNIGRTKWL